MHNAQRFDFTVSDGMIGELSLMPKVPITLAYQNHSVAATTLLDTGSAINVLPYRIGVGLGATWEQMTTPIKLGGNLANYQARLLIVFATVGKFDATRLVFAWTQADHVPVILGQVNFFMEFNVCFYRSQQAFDIHPKTDLALIRH